MKWTLACIEVYRDGNVGGCLISNMVLGYTCSWPYKDKEGMMLVSIEAPALLFACP